MSHVLVRICDYVYDGHVLPAYIQFSSSRTVEQIEELVAEYMRFSDRSMVLIGDGKPKDTTDHSTFGAVDYSTAGWRLTKSLSGMRIEPLVTSNHTRLLGCERVVLSPVLHQGNNGHKTFIRTFWIRSVEMMTADEDSVVVLNSGKVRKLFH